VAKPGTEDAAIRDAAASLVDWWEEAGVEPAAPLPARRRSAPETPTRRQPSAARSAKTDKPARPDPGAAVADARRLAAEAGDLAALKAAVESFEGCSLKASAQNTVFSRGSLNSGVMIIGEAPGFEEDRSGEPFVGRSGRLLDRMFAAIGLDRADIYVTNILFWRPPGNREPSDADIRSCLAFVERHVALARPRVLVLAGKTAAHTLLKSNDGIMRTRGKWGSYAPPAGEDGEARAIPALPIFHPAFLLRKPDFKRQTWRDLLSLQKRLEESS